MLAADTQYIFWSIVSAPLFPSYRLQLMVAVFLMCFVNGALRVTPSMGIVCMVVPLQNQLFMNKTFAGTSQNLTNENNTTLNGVNAPISGCVEMEQGKIDLGYKVKIHVQFWHIASMMYT